MKRLSDARGSDLDSTEREAVHNSNKSTKAKNNTGTSTSPHIRPFRNATTLKGLRDKLKGIRLRPGYKAAKGSLVKHRDNKDLEVLNQKDSIKNLGIYMQNDYGDPSSKPRFYLKKPQ